MPKRISASLSLALLLAALPARAQTGPEKFDVAPVKDAINRLKQFPAAVQKVQGVVKNANFGPFEIGGKCDYNRQWYCLGLPCNTWKWSWKFPGYGWLRSNLSDRYATVSSVSSQFDQRFSPVKDWLTRTVPDFSRQLDAAADRMEKAQGVLSNSASTAAAKEAAKKEIVSALTDLDRSLQQGSSQLQAGMTSLSQFNQQISRAIGNVETGRQSMESMFANDERNMNSQMSGWPCGQDDVRNQYRGVANTVRGQFDGAINAGKNFGLQSADADKAVSTILGTILNFQAAYSGVLDSLESALLTPSAAVQRLHLGVAKTSWSDLAAYARQQFGN
jgi:hypothetical protein